MLIGLGALAAFYFIYRTIVLTKTVETLSKELILSKYSLPNEKQIAEDSFFKFISDSRDWAFEYIEVVQSGLNKFVDDVDSYMNYWDKTVGVVYSPHDQAIQKVVKSYKELKLLLPEEQKND